MTIMNRNLNLLEKSRFTVIQEFAPVTLIGKVFGTFPLKVINVSNTQVYVTSRGAMIYSIILLGLTIIELMYLPQMTIAASRFVNGYNEVVTNKYNVTAENLQNSFFTPPLLTRLLNGIIMSLTGILSKINAIFYVRNYTPRVFSELKAIDSLLNPTLKQRRRNINTIWTLVVLSILVGIPGQIFSWIFIHLGKSYFIGIYVFVNILNNFTAVSAEAQFLVVCYLLKSRFEIVNQRLLDIQNFYNLEKNINKNITNEIIPIETGALGILSLSEMRCTMVDLKKDFTMNKKSFFKKKEENLYSKISIAHDLGILRISHQRLCAVLDQVNYMFQLQLLISIGGCFLSELLNIYSLLSGGAWKINKNTEDLNASNNANISLLSHPLINLIWGIYYGSRIVAMAILASKTIHVAKNSLIHLSDIRESSLNFATKEELSFFRDFIVSRKIEFSAFGFFNLDIALLSSIVATGSTYLAVMIQFRGEQNNIVD